MQTKRDRVIKSKVMKRIIATLLLLLPIAVAAQNDIEETARRALIVGRNLPQERVYLQFDNDSYYLGETMWFKAYVTSNNDDRASSISKVLYVEIVAPEGYVVETKKYKLDENGTCHGEFDLNVLLLSGYYEIRAYTRYMLNWGDESIFSRVLPVYDKVNGNNWDFRNMLDRKRGFMYRGEWKSSKQPDCNLKFYPEGGHLVENITSTVAYELRSIDGAFGKDTVTIYEDNKAILTTIPSHNGKGTFRLTPEPGKRYSAKVLADTENGKKKLFSFELPKVNIHGVALAIEQSHDSIKIRVTNNYTEQTDLGLAILHRGVMGFYKKFTSDKKNQTFTLHKNALLEGVSRAVIFKEEIPLAERQFFVQHNTLQKGDRQTVRLNTKANNYQIRNLKPDAHKKITLTIEREDGKPIDKDAEFTVSVTDASGSQETSWDYNMYTYLLLGSELKGYIPGASQYFEPTNENRTEQLDLLMLTHGWTSYDWSKLTTIDISNMQPVEKGITLKGSFYEKRKDNRMGHKGSFILKPDKNNLTAFNISYDNKEIEQTTFRTDSTGSFMLLLDDFYGKRIGQLIPTRRYMHTEQVWYGYSLDRYFSPRFRLYDYWERRQGSPLEQKSNGEPVHISPFDYLLSPVEVTAKRVEERNTRPPHSEMRFDYLDEWEYAQDITFLKKSSLQDNVSQYALDELIMNNIMDSEMENFRSENSHDTDMLENEEEKNSNINILDNITPSGIILMPTNGYSKYIGRMRFSKEPFIGSNDRTHDRILTAEDVVKSAMYRHNYNWAYWVQLMAVSGEYNSDSVPTPDNNYYKGKDAAKMVNFKEFVIRSDAKTRSQFQNIATSWERKTSSLDNKAPDTKFYLGFLSQTYLIAEEGIDDAPAPPIFLQRLRSGENTGRSFPHNPNYVACMIPYSDEENNNTKIIPDFLNTGSSRYTSIQGYSKSKQFYSPDYSNMLPTGNNDHRRTLLWCPEAKVDDGKLCIELYNSSTCNAIKVNVDGVCGNTYYSNNMHTRTSNEATAQTHHHTTQDRKKEPTFKADSATMAQFAYEYELGEVYFNQKKYRQAVQVFAELVQYNYPPALRSIAICYLNGYGLKKNYTQATKFFAAAAEAGDAASMYETAMQYKNGTGTEKSLSTAVEWLTQAAELQEPRAQAELGKYYLTVEKDTARAVVLYRASAQQNNAEGLYLYGLYMLEKNRADETEAQSALAYIKNAAEKQHTEAMLHMMHHYDKAQDFKAAYEWSYKLYLQGNKEGTLYMAECYKNGRGVKKDKQMAEDLYREAEK